MSGYEIAIMACAAWVIYGGLFVVMIFPYAILERRRNADRQRYDFGGRR